jgi:hypothetical protein
MSNEESIDVHKLHLIRESPEYKVNALMGELAALQQRLVAETTPPSPIE